MQVAIVHYWFVGMRGGEKVVEALCDLYPEADLYTHVWDPDSLSPALRDRGAHTTFIQKLPRAKHWYQKYLPLMPFALEQLDLRGYDLVISSESGPAKGVLTDANCLHICYCHTPMRYVWDMYQDYLESQGRLMRLLIRPPLHYMRVWDQVSAARVDHFIANSHNVARRIRKHYRRDAEVIYPPVETGAFARADQIGDFYLIVGQLVRYKRVDLAVEAFNRLGRPLVVIGTGGELAQLRALAGPNVSILGHQPFDVIQEHYSRCRAFVFPGIEDFGIVVVEAMAAGRPVIAFGQGGALETVIDGKTGHLFYEQSVDSLCDAVRQFEETESSFDTCAITSHARNFDVANFKQQMADAIARLLDEHQQFGV